MSKEPLLLKQAIDEIRCAYDGDEPVGHHRPYFFIVGAGVSVPAVPLAKEIVAHCEEYAHKQRRADVLASAGATALDAYSHWFERAYPHRGQRQRYLRSLIAGKPITHANLRLAHLLASKQVASLVVTPNFDDFLSRGLTLFGVPHIICDHPHSVERIDPDSDDVQIVHVHGSYWFYDCCNLRDELQERARASAHTTATMAAFLDRLLSRSSPLVLGYSGWEGDVIMTALRRRLQTALPCRLYWFCYRREDLDSLPAWLRSHPDVRFVAAQQPAEVNSDGHLREPSGGKESEVRQVAALEYGTKAEDAGRLPAQKVLEEFFGAFAIDTPELTRDPLGFYARHLGRSLLESERHGKDDFYMIHSVIARIQRADALEQRNRQDRESEIETVLEAMRRSQYADAVRQAEAIPLDRLTEEQLRNIYDVMWSAAESLSTQPDVRQAAYGLVLKAGQDLIGQGVMDRPALDLRIAMSLVRRGAALGRLGRREKEVEAYDEAIARFGEASVPALQEQVAMALVNKGVSLGQLGRAEEALGTYDEVVKRFGEASEPALRKQVAMAQFNKGVDLGELGRAEEALSTYDEVIKHFGEANEPIFRQAVAGALVNKGVALGDLGREEEAVGTCDEVVKRFGEASEPLLREHIAKAQANKGLALRRLGRAEEAVDTYDEVVKRFGEAGEPVLREQVAIAQFSKGVALKQLGCAEEEIGAYDEVVKRFGEASNLALREQVAKALVNKGSALGRLGRAEEAVWTCDEVMKRFGEASEPILREQVARALVNKGIALERLGRAEDVVGTCDEIVKRFGEASEPALRKQVASALLNKGDALDQRGQREEALASYGEVIKRFDSDGENLVQEQVAAAYGNLGIQHYLANEYDQAAESFLAAFQRGSSNAAINLAYMSRRGELPASLTVPPFATLLSRALQEKEPIAIVNQALYLARAPDGHTDWEAADRLIASLRETQGVVEEVSWWFDRAREGDLEGQLVTAWLARHGITDPSGPASETGLLVRARAAGWLVPEWMEHPAPIHQSSSRP